MVGPSFFFYAIFVIPYVLFMYWLVKQDKKKYLWGVIVVTVITILGLIVSQTASKIAVENYKQHQIDAREIESDQKQESQNN